MSHTSYKVTIGRGDTSLPFRQNTHITSKTGAAGGRTDDRSSLDKGLQKSFFHCLQVDRLRRRDHDATHSRSHMPALQNLSCDPEIIQPAIGSGADHYLVDYNILFDLIDGLRILRKMRESNRRPQRT